LVGSKVSVFAHLTIKGRKGWRRQKEKEKKRKKRSKNRDKGGEKA
jgi:hypothetical protein